MHLYENTLRENTPAKNHRRGRRSPTTRRISLYLQIIHRRTCSGYKEKITSEYSPCDILEYVGDGRRPYEEGERVYKSNHVLFCEITQKDENETHFLALCLKSSALTEAPHEIKVVLKKGNRKILINCVCSCVAGVLGKCKHSVGVLMLLSRTPQCQIEEATCTDVKQQWGKLKATANKMYAALPISEFCHLQKEKETELIRTKPLDPSIGTSFLNILTAGLADSKCELLKVKSAYRSKEQKGTDNNEEEIKARRCLCEAILQNRIHSSTQNLLDSMTDIERYYYLNEVCVNVDNAIKLCMDTHYQNNTLWHEERKKRITASNAYSLYTYAKNKNADWESKIVKHLNSNFRGNADTKHGLLMEDAAIDCYERCTDLHVTSMGILVNPSIPWLGYSPDGIVKDRCIIEIKSPKIGKTESASNVVPSINYLYYDTEGNVLLKEKHKYFCQVQLGMFITGLLFCHFIIYCSFNDSCLIIEVPFNTKLVVENYIPVLEKMYFQYVLNALVLKSSTGEKENHSNNIA